VNLFISSRLNWQAKGLVISQKTNFPDSETTQLMIESVKSGTLSINIRYPGWVDPGKMEIKVNGKREPVEIQPAHYVTLKRQWKRGDKIEVRLPMKITTERLPDNSNYIAFLHGPIVLAARTDKMNADSARGNGKDQFGGFRAKGTQYPMDSVPVLVSNDAHPEIYVKPVKGKPQTFTAPDLISPLAFKQLELIPFYKLHDSRYVIYWPIKN